VLGLTLALVVGLLVAVLVEAIVGFEVGFEVGLAVAPNAMGDRLSITIESETERTMRFMSVPI
jgi:acyl dehydratase